MKLWGRLRRSIWKVLFGMAALAVVSAAAAWLLSREVRYLTRAGYEEARILLKRRSLESLRADSSVDPHRRHLFDLVLSARAFAADSLGLVAGDTYTTFTDVGRDTLLLVLSASPKTALEPYSWRYPIVGSVPYKGFFDPGAATGLAERLDEQGYDTYLRPAGAFSTLGWFNDPLLSTALYDDAVSLVATVIHEIAHNTIYVPSATHFNESFASFVGYRGAESFFRSRGDTINAQRAAAMWNDELELARFYEELASSLNKLYEQRLDETVVLGERRRIFGAARDSLAGSLGHRLETYSAAGLARRTLNNASVIAAQLYRTNLTSFDTVFHGLNGDLKQTVVSIATAVRENAGTDPFQLLAEFESW
ncbi:MAG: aminopeptidase [Gemmatimonadota bacterium]|nr:MAG: aminopeptidase [Gemmatimonadota bacterium]